MSQNEEEVQIRIILESWANNTRLGKQDAILENHSKDLVIFDVLPPMMYCSADAYRESWDDWQPSTEGGFVFELRDLEITAGQDVVFAYALLHCGGTLPDGTKFTDDVRITFCLQKINGTWLIIHQHVSKPYGSD